MYECKSWTVETADREKNQITWNTVLVESCMNTLDLYDLEVLETSLEAEIIKSKVP